MKPAPSAEKSTFGTRWRYLRPYLLEHRGPILWGWIFVVASTALDQINPWMVKLILDRLQRGEPMARVAQCLGAILLATAVSGVLLYFQRLWVIQASRKMEYSLRRDLFAGLMAQPKAFFDKQTVGDLMSRATNDLDRIRDMVGPVVLHLARMGCLLVFTAACIWLLHPKLLLIGLLPSLLMPVIANVFLQRMYAYFGRIQKSLSALNAFVQDTLSGMQVVKGFGRAEPFEDKFRAASEELRSASLQVARFNSAIWPAIGVLGVVGVVLSAWLGGRMVVRNEITLGTLSAAMLYLLRLQFPLIGLGWVASMVQRANVSLDRLIRLERSFLIRRPPTPGVGGNPRVAPAPGGEVFQSLETQSLNFSYDGKSRVLENISLSLRSGESFGIVGPTGSGKTTLLHILCGLYAPPPHSLLLNGKTRENVSDEEWRRFFSYAPQDGFLFSTTIRENILFGGEENASLTVEKTAEWSGLSRDLPQFPDGYASLLGEKGINLSGGQRQRVGLARALLSPAPILCLDDTLSALDAETEEAVLQNLRGLFRDRCLVIAAHRYSAVMHCDQIAYLDHGRIVEQGTHEELIALGGSYAGVWEKQRLSESLEKV